MLESGPAKKDICQRDDMRQILRLQRLTPREINRGFSCFYVNKVSTDACTILARVNSFKTAHHCLKIYRLMIYKDNRLGINLSCPYNE